MKLGFIRPVEKNGKKMVLVSDKDMSSELENTTIGYVLAHDQDVSLDAMDKFVDLQWRKYEDVKVKTYSLESSVFIFDFASAESKQKILEKAPWIYEDNPLILRPLTPDVSMEKKELMKSVSTWIKLPYLNLNFWSPKMLSKIVSTIGTPLFTDKLTATRERLVYARVYVEIHVDQEQPDTVLIELGNGLRCCQKVEYEWQPPKCMICEEFGHSPLADFCLNSYSKLYL